MQVLLSRPVELQTLAAAGVASRRAAEDIIFAGRVLVNGKKESLPQRKVAPWKDKVCLHISESFVGCLAPFVTSKHRL